MPHFHQSYKNSSSEDYLDSNAVTSAPRFTPMLTHTTVPTVIHSPALAFNPVIPNCDSALTAFSRVAQMPELAGDTPLRGNPVHPSGFEAVPKHNHFAQPPQDSVVDAIMTNLCRIPLETRLYVFAQCMARVTQDDVRLSDRCNGDTLRPSSRDIEGMSLQSSRCMDEVASYHQPDVIQRMASWSDMWTETPSAWIPAHGRQVPSVATNRENLERSHLQRGNNDAYHPVEAPAQHPPLGIAEHLSYTPSRRLGRQDFSQKSSAAFVRQNPVVLASLGTGGSARWQTAGNRCAVKVFQGIFARSIII
ncbi:hypothetical protein BS17DRAFT_814693 [Gyrodon lividus]|nr:hypothetical protein BS17DRAFT_814693 [Gyrodon lividus]